MRKNKLAIFCLIFMFTWSFTSNAQNKKCNLKAQDKDCDSCLFYSQIFQDSCHYCENSYFSRFCFSYLEKHCFKIGDEEQKIINLFGVSHFGYPITKIIKGNVSDVASSAENLDYDYHISYLVSAAGCVENCQIIYLPTTIIYLFFKDKKLVGSMIKDYG